MAEEVQVIMNLHLFQGEAVVDYIICNHASLHNVTEFKVIPTKDLVDRFNLTKMLGDRCKGPDHSVLLACIKFTNLNSGDNSNDINHDNPDHKYNLPRSEKRYYFDKVNP